MTFGVIEKEEPLVAELIALAVESAGHDCLVFKDVDQAAGILHAIHLDAIVLHVHMPGRSGLDWLETMVTTWPDLPSRALLLTTAELTPAEAARIKNLGVDVVFGPYSLAGIELVVTGRVQKARSGGSVRSHSGWMPAMPTEFLN